MHNLWSECEIKFHVKGELKDLFYAINELNEIWIWDWGLIHALRVPDGIIIWYNAW